MKPKKIYLETTIFNYYFDTNREAHEATVNLFKEIEQGKYKAYTSIYVIDELEKCYEPKRGKMIELIKKYKIVVLEKSEKTEKLAEKYIAEGMIPDDYDYDAFHIAVASINDLDYIISCNFKHINRINTKVMAEKINIEEGYKGIIICTPMEVIDNE